MTEEPPGEHPPTDTALPQPEALPPAAEEPYPFWGYSDLLLFIGLAIPSMVAGWAVVKAVLVAFRIDGASSVVKLLCEQLVGYAILFSALAVLLSLHYERPFWPSLGWRETSLPFLWMVICGLTCAFVVAMLGSLIGTPTTPNPMTEMLKDPRSAILLTIFGTTVAPLSEELAFRGFIQPLLVRSLGAAPGIVLASIPFGLLHYGEYGNSWRHVVLISLAGAAFGWMRQATGSTKASTVMHASYNALIFFSVFSHQ